MQYYNATCPLTFKSKISKKSRHCNLPKWVDKQLKLAKQDLMLSYQDQKDSNSTYLKEKYRTKLTAYRSSVNRAKKEFLSNRILTADNINTACWNVINQKRNPNSNVGSQIDTICIDNNNIDHPNAIANCFNEKFLQILDTKFDVSTSANLLCKASNPSTKSFFITPTTSVEVLKCINSLRNSNSKDYYGFNTKVIKKIGPYISDILAHMINSSFEQGIFPLFLKKNVVTPVHKKESKSNPDNYRPISIIPIISKIFEKLMLHRLNDFFIKNDYFAETQFGFRSQLNTNQAIYNFIHEILKGLHEKKYPIGICCDLSKAFDSVNHELLLQKLLHYGIRGLSLNLSLIHISEPTRPY